MAKLQMSKIEIIMLLEDSKRILELLQKRGVVEIEKTDDEMPTLSTAEITARLDRNIKTAKSALESVKSRCGIKPSMLDALNGRKKISEAEFLKESENAEKILSLANTINDYEKKISALKSERTKLQTKLDALFPWESMTLPLAFKGSKKTRTYIGALPGALSKDEIEEMLGGLASVDVISSQKEQTCIVVTCLLSDSDDVYSSLRDGSFSPLTVTSRNEPKDEINSLKKSISDNEKAEAEYIDKITQNRTLIPKIEFLADYLAVKRDRYSSAADMGITRKTAAISGYIPSKYADSLKQELVDKFNVAAEITAPADDDDPPVLLENGRFSEPVEGITQMYALPNKRDVDPSSVMAFFYYLFFGMMLSDAGYGLLMVIGTCFILKKFNVEGTLRRSMKMFRNCGISTLIWGSLFGSWFGDLPQVIASNFFGKTIETTALWFEPLDNPIKLLLFSFALGIAHLFLGLAVNFKILWKEGKRFDAFCEVVPIYITILGVAPLAASILTSVSPALQEIGKYMMIVGVILILLTSGRSSKNIFMRFFGGIYGLYNIATGYLSDILSYSRLLALGLATGSIASVINLIGTMPQNIVLKAVLLTVVGVVGHTANLGINLLGAYVHSDRLQFVELFSKFYEGGGRAFKPLKMDTEFININEN